MKLNCVNTSVGLVPMYPEDWDERKRLRLGEVYSVEVKPQRNLAFHRKYFALVKTAWEYLPEQTSNGFRSMDAFRKYCEVAAGYYDPFFSPVRGEFVEVPRSIAFDRMDDAEFSELYERVKDVIWGIIGGRVTREEFERNMSNF